MATPEKKVNHLLWIFLWIKKISIYNTMGILQGSSKKPRANSGDEIFSSWKGELRPKSKETFVVFDDFGLNRAVSGRKKIEPEKILGF